MIRLAMVLMVALVSGCGSVNALRRGKTADFALISEGEVGGAYAVFAGEGQTCKVTEFGELKHWQVTYKGKRCQALLNGGAASSEYE